MKVWLGAILLLAMLVPALADPPAGPYTPEGVRLREQFWLIPTSDPDTPLMRAVVLRPPGEEPRPLAVIAHPTMDNTDIRAGMAMLAYVPLSRLLVQRGYVVVVPIRRGYGATGGRYREWLGACAQADFRRPAMEGARDLAATVALLRRQPFVASSGLVLAGQAGGSLAALAYAAEKPVGLSAVILFSTGRGASRERGATRQCRESDLVSAISSFAAAVPVEMMMIAAENDALYPPALARRLDEAMRAAGARVRLRVLPPVGDDGHDLLGSFEGPATWLPAVGGFLTEVRP